MAVLYNNDITLLDLAKRTENGTIAKIVELLTEQNEVLMDMTWVEGNLTTGMRTTIRTGLPIPTWRQLYGGVQPTKSTTSQVDEGCGMLQAYSEMDKALADLNSNAKALRMSEEMAHLQGMNNEMSNVIFYGNEKIDREKFTGLSPRYSDLSANNKQNIIDAGGTGSDNASIWLVTWGMNTCFGIVPKGLRSGFQRFDLGEVTIEDVDGKKGRMQAYRTMFKWDAGLCLKDWRYVVRICNIDKSLLMADSSQGGANLTDLIHDALNVVESLSMGKPAIYINRYVMSFLRKQVSNQVSQSTLSMDNVGGTMQTTFMGIPLRRCDALAADEARVV